MKLIEFKIRRFKELIMGILIDSGTKWSLIKVNVVDYVLDGLQFTNKKYVVYESEIKENTIQHKILSIKNKTEKKHPLGKDNLLNDDKLLYSYLKRKELLIAICMHREDVLYVGKITKIKSRSFVLTLYDTELRNCGIKNIEFTKVRYIQIHTDYLDSLCLLLNQEKSIS